MDVLQLDEGVAIVCDPPIMELRHVLKPIYGFTRIVSATMNIRLYLDGNVFVKFKHYFKQVGDEVVVHPKRTQ